MADERRFPHTRIPNFIFDAERFPRMTAGMIATYAAVRSFAYTRSKASDKFGRAWPSIPSIAKRARQSERMVKRNLKALENMHLLYRRPRPFTSAITTFVDYPEAFERALKDRGIEAAQAENDVHLEEIREGAFGERARISANRMGVDAAVTPHGCSRDTPLDAAVTPHGVRRVPVRTHKEELRREEHKREEHDSTAIGVEPPSTALSNSKGNGKDTDHDPDEIKAGLRAAVKQGATRFAWPK